MSDTAEINDPQTWLVAKRLARLLGPVPSSVGNAVKSMWRDHMVCLETGNLEISRSTNSCVRLLDRSSVLKMPLYFAAQSLHPERFADMNEDDTSRALIKILHPGLFASLLSLLYVHRRFNKICSDEQWESLSKEFILNMELGFLIGRGCPRIGEAIGVLVGGIRYAAVAIYLKHDVKAYDGYRNRKLIFNVIDELDRFGCDHGQVAGLLIRALGFSGEQMQVAYALRGHSEGQVKSEFVVWSVVIRLMEALKNKQELTSVDLSDLDFTLSSEELSAIADSTNTLFEKGSTFSWMLRNTQSAAAE